MIIKKGSISILMILPITRNTSSSLIHNPFLKLPYLHDTIPISIHQDLLQQASERRLV